MLIARLVGLSLVVPFVTSCSVAFDFAREETEVAGEVGGRALREDDDQPASYARVRVQGYGIDKSAGLDGLFRVSSLTSGNWVFDLVSDEDGNGWAERKETVKVRVTTWAPPLSVPLGGVGVDVPFVDGVPEPVAIALGDVHLKGTVAFKGTLQVERAPGDVVAPSEAGYVGRVFIVRDTCFATADEGPAVVGDDPCPEDLDAIDERLTNGAEAVSGVDARGFYGFQGVRPGTFTVVAALYAQGTLFQPIGPLLAVSTPVELTRLSDDGVDPNDDDVPEIRVDDPLGIPFDELTRIEINIAPSHDVNLARVMPQRAVIIFTPADAPRPPCTVGIAAGLISGYKDITSVPAVVLPTDRGFIATLDAPVGHFDMQVCTDIGEGSVDDVVILPPRDDAPAPRYGPARVRYTPLCGEDGRDCDDDGLEGLPPLDPLDDGDQNRTLWQACATTCADITTPDVTASTCDVNGVEYDCDDDGDLQADVTEHPNCYGPGLGADRDGDGLCDGQDPFPTCFVNDPAVCDPDRAPDVTTTLSPAVADPRCAPGAVLPAPVEVCVVEGDPAFEEGCDRVKMACAPRLARTPECFFDEDCADGEVCSRGACSAELCTTSDECGAGRSCYEGVCREDCAGFDDATCGATDRCLKACPDGVECPTDDERVFMCIPLGTGSEGATCEGIADCGRGLTCVGIGCECVECCDGECAPRRFACAENVCMRLCNENAARPCPSESQECCAASALTSTSGPGECDAEGDRVCTPYRIEETCLCEDQASELSVEIDAAFTVRACDAEGVAQRWPTCNLFTVFLPEDLSWDRPDAGSPIVDAGVDDDAGAQPTDAGSDDAGVSTDAGPIGEPDAGAVIVDSGLPLDAG